MPAAGVDLDRVVPWLRSQGIDLGSQVTATLYPSGRSNITMRLDGERSVVLRRPPLGHVMPTAHDMAREHRVLTGLHRAGFPVPEPLALCTDERVNGCTFLIMAPVAGRIIETTDDAAALTIDERANAGRLLIGTLADLHAIDPRAAGLDDLGRPDGYLGRQHVRWAKQWELTRTRDLPPMDALHARVGAMLAGMPDDRAAIVHGDFRLDNVILDVDAASVRAVLDWEMSTLGDPVSDLALTLVYWSQAHDHLRHRIPVATHLTDADGFLDRAELVAIYSARSGDALADLDACTALACYKLAVITESIHARTLAGQQLGTAATATGMGEATEALAEMGLAVCAHGAIAGLAT